MNLKVAKAAKITAFWEFQRRLSGLKNGRKGHTFEQNTDFIHLIAQLRQYAGAAEQYFCVCTSRTVIPNIWGLSESGFNFESVRNARHSVNLLFKEGIEWQQRKSESD